MPPKRRFWGGIVRGAITILPTRLKGLLGLSAGSYEQWFISGDFSAISASSYSGIFRLLVYAPKTTVLRGYSEGGYYYTPNTLEEPSRAFYGLLWARIYFIWYSSIIQGRFLPLSFKPFVSLMPASRTFSKLFRRHPCLFHKREFWPQLHQKFPMRFFAIIVWILHKFEKLPPKVRETATLGSRNCHFGVSRKPAWTLGRRAFLKTGKYCRYCKYL